ncbi:hypothetical protein BU26DRAFT_595799 [Trematosphaeria pertusa]|uniref:RING-type domain-containing protein n=1 Tax=Trematosphaeria pertusa TaxID=390896 RepID=A0A6A6IEL1_9PLEO|nr:uncharacterized protein BU26DRAFT_595799 [Trematosphaeria pertusa]KAF2247980.1 hypothetical protein BU26DRAFT_595799 [Trematosphaeria pertusa]
MDEPSPKPPPYSSKEDLIANGLQDFSPNGELECPICRELIIAGTPTPSTLNDSPLPTPSESEDPFQESDNRDEPSSTAEQHVGPDIAHIEPQQSQHPTPPHPSTTSTTASIPGNQHAPNPETAVLLPCAHVFGLTCLLTWLSAPTGNRCPTCNQTLFPLHKLTVRLREPTRAMRAAFAEVVETLLGDPETAAVIRRNLMSGWTRALMRELALAVYGNVNEGWEVEYVYEGGGEGEEEEDGDGVYADDMDEDEDEEDEEDGDGRGEVEYEDRGVQTVEDEDEFTS